VLLERLGQFKNPIILWLGTGSSRYVMKLRIDLCVQAIEMHSVGGLKSVKKQDMVVSVPEMRPCHGWHCSLSSMYLSKVS
jgi:hypothetical protein